MIPEFVLGTQNLRAVVTTRWGRSGYTPLPIRQVESYYVDTSLDNDADPWVVEIGDGNHEFMELLHRDNEVRVALYGIGRGTTPLLTGIADEITYTSEGTMSLTGRDLSSIAIDSTAPPQQFRHVRADKIVNQQAIEIGFKNTRLAKQGVVKKVQYSDGSESYWEFWYRLYRKEKMWLWTEPNGTLIADKLNYTGKPIYFFGVPRHKDPKSLYASYIPVERMEITKSTQGRVGEVWVFGQKGDNGFLVMEKDPTTRGWVKRPRRILYNPDIHTRKAALKLAWQEIFEGKVGSVEVKLTIADPGFMVRQNQIAVLNLPISGIGGEWFVVGVRSQAGADGYLQEIRLRQKDYAISRRVPTEPKSTQTQAPLDPDVATGSAQGLSIDSMENSWGAYFVKAAQKWHGPWDYTLYLATLIAIAHQETGGAFANIRSNGGPGGSHVPWYQWNPAQTTRMPLTDKEGRTKEEWEEVFANEPGKYTGSTWAVGPMQLYSLNYKHFADDLFKNNYRDQYQGGRWHPEHNIMGGAYALRTKLQQMVKDSGRDIDMWAGVSAYGHHYADETGLTVPTKYAVSVKNLVFNDPGYLEIVKTSLADARAEAAKPKPAFDPGDDKIPTGGYSNSPAQIETLAWVQRAHSGVVLEKVDWRLLSKLNSLGARLGRIITITSGWRSYEQQAKAYAEYVASGYSISQIAAKPGTSNHEFGRACDCVIGGVPIGTIVPAATLAIFGLHCSVQGDPVHCTRTEVTG